MHARTMSDSAAYLNVSHVDAATVAVAREMLAIAYHMLTKKEPHREFDQGVFDSKPEMV